MSKKQQPERAVSQISASAVRWLFDGAEQLQVDIDNILAACGLDFSAEDFQRGRVDRIPTAAYCQLYYQLNYLLQMHANEAAGHRGFSAEEFRLLCNCLITAETLEEAMRRMVTFFDMLRERFPGSTMEVIRQQGECHFYIGFSWGELSETKSEIEKKTLFLFYFLFSWLIGEPIELRRVDIRLPEQVDHFRLKHMFNCPVQFGCDRHCLIFGEDFLSRGNIRGYEELKLFLARYPSMLLSPISMIGNSLPEQLKQIMVNMYFQQGNFPTFSELAGLYQTSESSLGRRLRKQQHSYTSLREQCQFDMAREYMWRPELSIADIATLLGFSDANSFSRSFRKWAGMPPAAFRKSLAS